MTKVEKVNTNLGRIHINSLVATCSCGLLQLHSISSSFQMPQVQPGKHKFGTNSY